MLRRQRLNTFHSTVGTITPRSVSPSRCFRVILSFRLSLFFSLLFFCLFISVCSREHQLQWEVVVIAGTTFSSTTEASKRPLLQRPPPLESTSVCLPPFSLSDCCFVGLCDSPSPCVFICQHKSLSVSDCSVFTATHTFQRDVCY